MTALTKRLIFDILMTVLLIVEMFVQITGIFAHEIIGVVFCITIIVHLVLERSWIAGTVAFGTHENGLSPRHMAKLVVAIVLLVDMVLLVVSSVLISTILFDAGARFDAFYLGGIWYPIHAVASYVLCALVVIHSVMHWSIVASALKVSYDPERREAIGQGIGAVATLGVIALCVGGATTKSVQDYVEASAAAADAASASGTSSANNTSSSSNSNANSTSNSNTNSSANANSASNTAAGNSNASGKSASSSSSASTSSASSAYDTYETSSSGYTTADICPLCPKKCQLSAPKCDRPYDEGIIARP